jgi:hypothetical protein
MMTLLNRVSYLAPFQLPGVILNPQDKCTVGGALSAIRQILYFPSGKVITALARAAPR